MIVGVSTDSLHFNVFLPTLAVILQTPFDLATILPFELTFATFLLELDHFTLVLVPDTFNVNVCPFISVAVFLFSFGLVAASTLMISSLKARC